MKEKIASIEEVQRAAEEAMGQVTNYLRSSSDPTSEQAHQVIDEVLQSLNCESPEGHIVAGGIASAEPHEAGSGVLFAHQPIVIDIYPRSKKTGYFADMTRTVCIGEAPARLQEMYDAVLAAQELAISLLRPGMRGEEIHEAVLAFFKERGFETSGQGKEFRFAEGFVHSIGHGVGQIIHDAPHLCRGPDILREGDIVAIEPGLYYKSIGGVRLEDLLLITGTGAENLTRFPKSLLL